MPKMHASGVGRIHQRGWAPRRNAAGCLILAMFLLHGALAAHEPELPVLADDAAGEELDAAGGLAGGATNDDAPQQQQQQQQQRMPPPGNAVAPSPSPAPKLATILPMIPMVLPGCPNEDILNSNKPWVFPQKWASMSAQQQALHPINLLFMNMVGIPSTDLMAMVTPCLHSWGIVKGSVTKIVKDYKVGNSMAMKTVVLVMRSKRHVYVLFRSTDDDWVADFDCMYTDDLRHKLNVPTPPIGAKKLQLHRGFWAAYQAVDKQLFAEVQKQLKLVKTATPFSKPQVWLLGHSLGGALATIAAFKMHFDTKFPGEVGAVLTWGSPRVGNEVWQQLYHDKLLPLTLRWSNHRDLFAALPANGQFCLSNSPLKTVFSFRHVGKAVLLCPSTAQPGLQEFQVFPKGTETSCNTGEVLIIGTHLLGHYFDGWRRAYALQNGFEAASVLSAGPHVRSVMCAQCALAVKPYPLPDNKAARNDGVVSCVADASCNNKTLFSVVSWAGVFPTSFFRTDAVCEYTTSLCQVPSRALTQVQNRLLDLAPNITSAMANMASKALQANPLGALLGFGAPPGGNGTAALGGNGTGSGIGSSAGLQLPSALASLLGNWSGGLPAAAINMWSEHLRDGVNPNAAAAVGGSGSREEDEEDVGGGVQVAGAASGAAVAALSASGGRGAVASAGEGEAADDDGADNDDDTMLRSSNGTQGATAAHTRHMPAVPVGGAASGVQTAGGSSNGTRSSNATTSSSSSSAAEDAAVDHASDSDSSGSSRLTAAAAEGLRSAVRPMAAALHKLSTSSKSMLDVLSRVMARASLAAAVHSDNAAASSSQVVLAANSSSSSSSRR